MLRKHVNPLVLSSHPIIGRLFDGRENSIPEGSEGVGGTEAAVEKSLVVYPAGFRQSARMLRWKVLIDVESSNPQESGRFSSG